MCDTAVVVGPDRVLFAKNSDRDANEAQRLEWHPAAEHAPGSRVACTYLEIDQAPRTAAVLLSRPYWMWGAEMGANEHGVVIGNEGVFTRQPYAGTGLTGMDLLRLALERATTAEQAVQVMVALLEEHGQGGGCGHEHRGFTYHNSYLVADPTGARILETAGPHWAVEEVEPGPRTISNALTIPGFAEAHSDFLKTHFSRARRRQARTAALAGGASGPAEMMRLLRDHGDGRTDPGYDLLTGGLGAPCVHASGLAAASQTTASWVAALGPDGVRHWVTGTSAPCTGLFKPAAVDRPLEVGAPTDAADDSLWWRHERLHRAVAADPGRLLPLYAPERDATEARWLADPPDPAQAFAEGDRLLAAWTEAMTAVEVRDTRPAWVRRYWRVRSERAGL